MRTILVVPVNKNVGLTTVTLSVERAFSTQLKTCYWEPIGREIETIHHLDDLLSQNKLSTLLEEILVSFRALIMPKKEIDLCVLKGLSYRIPRSYVLDINVALARAFNAQIVLVASPADEDLVDEAVLRQIELTAQFYDPDYAMDRMLGCIVNRSRQSETELRSLFAQSPVSLLTCVPSMKGESEITLSADWISILEQKPYKKRLTPPMFNATLFDQAEQAKKTIVLPEGEEPRTIQAAIICAQKKVAHCILLGREESIRSIATQYHLSLPTDYLTIIDPVQIAHKYIKPMVELRKQKGLTEEEAQKQLTDSVVVGTMMVQQGEADGLVSGAIHTTANTVRPALQLIKMVPDANVVSSLFFMALPDEILVYADCAINQNPGAEVLADTAIQTADSAKQFGIDPRVAMISYSTLGSGAGPDVEKVQKAVELIRAKRSDIHVDGPLQYDAAADPIVGKLKAPKSEVAGRANVFIFPDLNTGNTVYKAVQRTNRIFCFGPMLQGLRKPVNDLSRGCLVEDIVYTIALTVVQSLK
ncbi:MAG: phosphate acetyltransferase [Gammaproteobacteria bacterium GWF2_41_13]|nr:MAG: phosphate acetyltransferase [Gammaproteobacteria bacterium GWF2_41_13]